jgi:hypothetical protein
MLISIGDYDFCDGTLAGGFAASDLRLRFTRGIEVVQALGSIAPVTYDRLTRTSNLSFSVQRTHASIKASELFIGNHEVLVPQSGPVKLTTAGGTIAFIANAFVVDIQLVQEIGSTTKHSYQIVGGVFDTHPGRPQTLNQVISTGVSLGLWPTMTVPTPTTLTEVIDAGTTLGLWPSGPVPVTPTTLNEVIAAGVALGLWL